VIAAIAPAIVRNLGRAEGTAARATIEVSPVAATEREPADRASPKACVAALAPAAMSALIEAQEHMARDATPTDRSQTAQKIDHILLRLTGAPPAQPAALAAQGDFSLQMLVAARRLLREACA